MKMERSAGERSVRSGSGIQIPLMKSSCGRSVSCTGKKQLASLIPNCVTGFSVVTMADGTKKEVYKYKRKKRFVLFHPSFSSHILYQ